MAITGTDNYFEDFSVGDVYEHVRGRTITDWDNYAVTHLSLNTAQPHFNQIYSRELMDGAFRDRLVAGPCTIGIVVGLTVEDMSENAFMDIGLTNIRMPNPVFAGDTLYASSEVLELCADESRPDAGLMKYRFTGLNQNNEIVCVGERAVLIKRRGVWRDRDSQFDANTQHFGRAI